ncbi:MAG: transglutaminase domain-containing protein [Clostridia bacterium]|nr:transglutaminase domain-containing protein [Clostridia bacterium]
MSKHPKQPKKEKAARRAKGPNKRAEKLAAKNRNLRALHPGLQIVSDWMTPVGLLLRLVPAYLLLAGLYLFLDNAFGFATPKLLFLPMIALVLLLHGAACWNKIVNVISWILTAAGGVLLLVLSSDPLLFLVNLGRGLYNSAISYMMTVGYGVLYIFKLDSPLEADAELGYAKIAFGVLQVIGAIIVARCTAKKLRVWPIAVITAFSYTLVFLYNISTSKWGIALSVAGICGLLCMKMADKYAALPKHKTVTAAELEEGTPEEAPADIGDVTPYVGDKKSEHAFSLRGAAVVGFSAVLCTLIALLAAAIPASRVKEPWRTYETIDTVMETIRAYEMALITGEDMQIADLGLTGAAEILNARSSIATPRYFTGKAVLEIQSNLNLPVYLRSWVSATFIEDKWYVADEPTRDAFDDIFPDDFSAEDLTYRFLRNLNPKLVNYKTKTSYVNHEDDGFMTTLISLKNLGVAGNILFLPSKMNNELSLQEYGSIEEDYQKRWINYFDGIAYSRAFHKGAKYSAVTFLPLYKEEDWWETFNQKLAAYATFMDVYSYVGRDIAALFENEKTTAFDTAYATYTLDKLGDYYLSLDVAGREQFHEEISEVQAYNDYVFDSGVYTSLTQDEALNEKLRALALEIIYSEPLPETGLIKRVDGEEVDYTDVLAQQAMQYTVGDVIHMLYATEDGKVYIDYDGSGVQIGKKETLAYAWDPNADADETEDVIEDADLLFRLDEQTEAILSAPFIEAREIRGTDNSLINVEYYVTNPDAYFAFLDKYAADTAYLSMYHTTFAQRIGKYLSENMTYTLNPTLPETEDTTSSVERFLFETGEGYCVQYATAATLLLRSVGIPTRYVEGYIAPKFSRNEAEDRVGNYIYNVKDYNAHAWCEIYIENYGWLTTEVTTPYYSDMYDPYESIRYNHSDSSSSTPVDTPVIEEIEEVEEEETLWDIYGDIVITVVTAAAIAAAVIYVLYRFYKNREAKRYRHTEMLKKAKQYLAAEDERAPIASALYDNLRKVAAVFDVKPMTGETPREYAHRLDMRFNVKAEDGTRSAAEAVYAFIAKNEFGDTALDGDELCALADYIVRLEDVIRAEVGFFRHFYLKYILGLMD